MIQICRYDCILNEELKKNILCDTQLTHYRSKVHNIAAKNNNIWDLNLI